MYARVNDEEVGMSKADLAIAMVASREEMEQLERDIHSVLGQWGPPTMTLDELRAMLDEKLGDVSLSDMIIEMRNEGLG